MMRPDPNLSIQFRNTQANFYVHDVHELAEFYITLGFKETFRTPEAGTPIYIELILDSFCLGITNIQVAEMYLTEIKIK